MPGPATDERSRPPEPLFHFLRIRCSTSSGFRVPLPGFAVPLPPDSMFHFLRIPCSTSSGIPTKCEALLAMSPVAAVDVPTGTPVGGIYLFSEGKVHLYAGRTKRSIRERIRNQFGANPSAASFPWLIAREATGRRATYRRTGSRRELLTDPQFRTHYQNARARIRSMQSPIRARARAATADAARDLRRRRHRRTVQRLRHSLMGAPAIPAN